MVENLKWIFIVFEGISRLKVNFGKPKLIPVNISAVHAQYFSNILGRKLGSLPIKYLGVSLHWKAPSREIWMDLVNKIHICLQIWKGKFLYLGGRVVLLNSILTSIPLYYLSLFKIPSWCLLKIDKIRRSFLWAGVDKGSHRHIVLMRWSIICTPKQYGGLGLLNLKFMNRALLLKWWVMIFCWDCTFMEICFDC
jgi:hypothetical protein